MQVAAASASPSSWRGDATRQREIVMLLPEEESSVRSSLAAEEDGGENQTRAFLSPLMLHVDVLLRVEKMLSEYCKVVELNSAQSVTLQQEMSTLRGRVRSLLVERRSFLDLSDVLRNKNRKLELERRRLQVSCPCASPSSCPSRSSRALLRRPLISSPWTSGNARRRAEQGARSSRQGAEGQRGRGASRRVAQTQGADCISSPC
eukprot:756760-Hanusia_phi.AAC.1